MQDNTEPALPKYNKNVAIYNNSSSFYVWKQMPFLTTAAWQPFSLATDHKNLLQAICFSCVRHRSFFKHLFADSFFLWAKSGQSQSSYFFLFGDPGLGSPVLSQFLQFKWILTSQEMWLLLALTKNIMSATTL